MIRAAVGRPTVLVARPGTPSLLRAWNDRAALDLLVRHGPLTRGDLVARTGLSKPTASQLLARLTSAGLVRPAGSQAGRRGPTADLFAVNGDAGLAAGVDLTPARAWARVVDLTGRVRSQARVDLGRRRTAPAAQLRAALDAAARSGPTVPRPQQVVVGVQGVYDPTRDALAFAAHLPGWSDPGLLGALAGAAGCPVTVENDVKLAAAAECATAGAGGGAGGGAGNGAGGPVAGPGSGCQVLLWLGDGPGLAVHAGGVLHRGLRGAAGEIGDLRVAAPALAPAGARVPPAVRLQDLLGGPAVLRLAAEHGVIADSPVHAVRTGSPALLGELAARIAGALGPVIAILDPDQVVLSGPVGRAGGDRLADLVAQGLGEGPAVRCVRVTQVPGNPVLAGACALALDRLRDAVFSSTISPGGAYSAAGEPSGDAP